MLPYLDEVHFPIIPDDATRVLKLKAGEIDATEFVPFSRIAELKADPKIDMALFPSAKLIYFNLNCRPTFKDGRKNPMAAVHVRQALNYATDKAALIQVLSYGFDVLQPSFMPMSTPYAWGPRRALSGRRRKGRHAAQAGRLSGRLHRDLPRTRGQCR